LYRHLDSTLITDLEKFELAEYFQGDTSLFLMQPLDTSGSTLICSMPEGIYIANAWFYQEEWEADIQIYGKAVVGLRLTSGKTAVAWIRLTRHPMYPYPIPWDGDIIEPSECE
jgi:hypothetical protein